MEACRIVIVATTRAALLRGTNAPDSLGDESDATTPVVGFEDFAFSIVEKDATEFDQASSTWRSVQRLIGRAAGDVPADEGDRIKDLRDGRIYAVDNVRRTPRGMSGRSSVTMKLRRTNP